MFDWYKIFNLDEFNALGLVSKTYQYYFDDLGLQSILVTKGNLVSMTYDGELLPIEFMDMNPFQSGSYAVFIDTDDNVWLGIEVEE
jgi:hypothetical protein